MGNYKALANKIIENVGGKENVNSVVHCITRLRFQLKDESKANTEALESMSDVVAVMRAGSQYQVVIGNHVPIVFEDVINILGLTSDTQQEDSGEKLSVFNRLIDIISGSFQPFLGAMAAGGMIKGLNALLVAFGALKATDGTYLMLNAIGDAIFAFLPIVVGISAARKFKLNEFVGLVLGAALMYPAIQLSALSAGNQPLGTLFKGTAIQSDYFSTFLKIPFIAQNYSGTVVPIIFTVWFASIIQKRAKKIIPELLQTFFVPFFTLLIATPIALMVIGPVLNIATNLLSVGFQNLLNFNPIIFMAIAAFFWQVMVIFGLHWALVSIAIVQLGADQFTQMLPGMFGASFAQIAVVFALWLKFRNQDKGLKTLAIPALISGIAGVTEPAIYGITLKRKKAFLYSMIGAAGGGAVMGIVNAKMYTMGGLGIFMLPSFVSPTGDMAFLYAGMVSMVIAAIIAFLLTFFFYKESTENLPESIKEKTESSEKTKATLSLVRGEAIEAPVKGMIKPLSESSDPVFSSGALGKGVVIIPSEGAIRSPFDGEVVTIFPTGHAVGLRSKDGAELLIHVGMDTVELNGKHYEKLVENGDNVKKGDVLVKFDVEAIKADGYVIETPVVVTNSSSYTDVLSYMEGDTVIETAA